MVVVGLSSVLCASAACNNSSFTVPGCGTCLNVKFSCSLAVRTVRSPYRNNVGIIPCTLTVISWIFDNSNSDTVREKNEGHRLKQQHDHVATICSKYVFSFTKSDHKPWGIMCVINTSFTASH